MSLSKMATPRMRIVRSESISFDTHERYSKSHWSGKKTKMYLFTVNVRD